MFIFVNFFLFDLLFLLLLCGYFLGLCVFCMIYPHIQITLEISNQWLFKGKDKRRWPHRGQKLHNKSCFGDQIQQTSCFQKFIFMLCPLQKIELTYFIKSLSNRLSLRNALTPLNLFLNKPLFAMEHLLFQYH